MGNRLRRVRLALLGLVFVGMLLVCGACGLMGARMMLQPDEPISVAFGTYSVLLVKMPAMPAGMRSSGLVFFTNYIMPPGVQCTPVIRPDFSIGDYQLTVFECSP